MAVQTISYSDKSYINENADISAVNKVQAVDMNEIKSVVNNNATETSSNTSNISSLQTYSTTEQLIGTFGADNLYKISYVGGAYTGGTTAHFDLNTTNIDKVIKIEGCFALSSTIYIPINFYNGTGVTRCHYSGSNQLEFVSNYSALATYITIYYTKS